MPGQKPILLEYVGHHLKGLHGKKVSTQDLAERVNMSADTVLATLHRVGSIRRGIVSDKDIKKYLPDAPVVNKAKLMMNLTARPWR